MMKFGVISIFPESFRTITDYGITARAIASSLMSLTYWNPRDYTQDRHKTVDDRPYGGGPGMVLLAEPMMKAIKEAKQCLPNAKVVYMSPQGRPFEHNAIGHFMQNEEWLLISGRYEGIDERVIENAVDEEWSIGDYVLSGGELASMVLIDAVCRNIPGVLGHEESAAEDSFYSGLLDCPHYTRPESMPLGQVPDVLLSGNHEHIRRWRLKQSLVRTLQRRPDRLEAATLNSEQRELLEEFKKEQS